MKSPVAPSACTRLLVDSYDRDQVFNIVKNNIGYFTQPEGNGVVLLTYSVLLTKGVDIIPTEMDHEGNGLLTEHGYASQELINIMLVGKARSNVFNGDQDLGDDYILKGVHK